MWAAFEDSPEDTFPSKAQGREWTIGGAADFLEGMYWEETHQVLLCLLHGDNSFGLSPDEYGGNLERMARSLVRCLSWPKFLQGYFETEEHTDYFLAFRMYQWCGIIWPFHHRRKFRSQTSDNMDR